MGIDILGIDILGIDIVALPHLVVISSRLATMEEYLGLIQIINM